MKSSFFTLCDVRGNWKLISHGNEGINCELVSCVFCFQDEYLDRIFEVDYLYPELRETMNTTCSSKITFPVSITKSYHATPSVTTVQ